jgi:predicted component of type VI protein secretion system
VSVLFIELAPGEIRALADVSRRHPDALAQVSLYRDEADVGWTAVAFSEGSNQWPYTRVTKYVLSPTGRAWVTDGSVVRGELVRGADYDPLGKAGAA